MRAASILHMWIPHPYLSASFPFFIDTHAIKNSPVSMHKTKVKMHSASSKELNDFSFSSTNSRTLAFGPLGAFHWLCVCVRVYLSACQGINVHVWPKTDYGPQCRAHLEVNVSMNELYVKSSMVLWGEIPTTLSCCTSETRQRRSIVEH